jgi:hypothetical protein
MSYLRHLLAVLVGAALTVQIGMNAVVRDAFGSAACSASCCLWSACC